MTNTGIPTRVLDNMPFETPSEEEERRMAEIGEFVESACDAFRDAVAYDEHQRDEAIRDLRAMGA